MQNFRLNLARIISFTFFRIENVSAGKASTSLISTRLASRPGAKRSTHAAACPRSPQYKPSKSHANNISATQLWMSPIKTFSKLLPSSSLISPTLISSPSTSSSPASARVDLPNWTPLPYGIVLQEKMRSDSRPYNLALLSLSV